MKNIVAVMVIFQKKNTPVYCANLLVYVCLFIVGQRESLLQGCRHVNLALSQPVSL